MWRALTERSTSGRGTSRTIAREFSHSIGEVQRLQLERTLHGHEGCVNTVSFTPDGAYLLSGSDDLKVICFDWQTGRQVYSYEPGHTNNIFQAKAIPHTDNRTIISCAADGYVYVSYLGEAGNLASKRRLARHRGRAHKLSIAPDNPQVFLSSGEDGQVLMFDLRAANIRRASENGTAGTSGRGADGAPVASMKVTEWDHHLRPLEVDAVHHNPARPWLFAVGGGDCAARVYDSRAWHGNDTSLMQDKTSKPTMVTAMYPGHMASRLKGGYSNHITCVQFSRSGELLATYHRDAIYLFSAEGASGMSKTRPKVNPDAMDTDSRVDRKRKAERDDAQGEGAQMEGLDSAHDRGQVAASPSSPKPQLTHDTSASPSTTKCSVVQGQGDHVVQSYSGHRNVQTVKGVSFLGVDDEYVVSGSDCGHVFIWQKEGGRLLRVMHGDEYVVNCLEPHPWQPLLLATSGIENTVKVWSPTSVLSNDTVSDVECEMKRVVEANEAATRRPRTTGWRRQISPETVLRIIHEAQERAAPAGETSQARDQDDEAAEDMQQVVRVQVARDAAHNPVAATLMRILFGDRAGADDDDDDDVRPDSDDDDQRGEGDESGETTPEWARRESSSDDEEPGSTDDEGLGGTDDED